MRIALHNFTGGEVSPILAARYDLSRYGSSVQCMENMLPGLHGDVRRRPGTLFLGSLEDEAVLLPFSFNALAEQNFVLVLSGNGLSIADIHGFDPQEGSIPRLPTPYEARHLLEICAAQVGDTVYLAHTAHKLIGDKSMSAIGRTLHRLGLPLWTTAMPKPYYPHKIAQREEVLKVVYFPSCINQTMGPAQNSPDSTPLVDKTVALLQKAGYEVIFPKNMKNLCCGTIWESKGMMDIADRKSAELEEALYQASNQGRYPVLCDQSPCLHRMREVMSRVKLYEPVEFIYTFLRDKLDFTPIDDTVAVHITCSMRKMNLGNMLVDLARLCSRHVVVPDEIGCCGFAGDRGFTHPEVNAYALRKLRPQLEKAGVKTGYSNSRTCEIGLTTNSGIPYLSIVYLVDQCTTPKQ